MFLTDCRIDERAAQIAWALADWSRRLDRSLDEALFEPFVWAFAKQGSAQAADHMGDQPK